jgi:hypothetical protein
MTRREAQAQSSQVVNRKAKQPTLFNQRFSKESLKAKALADTDNGFITQSPDEESLLTPIRSDDVMAMLDEGKMIWTASNKSIYATSQNSDLSPSNKRAAFTNRIFAGAEVIGGVVQTAAGVGFGILTIETGVGLAVGGVTALRGLDHIETGLKCLWTGEAETTAFGRAAHEFGLDNIGTTAMEVGFDLVMPGGLAGGIKLVGPRLFSSIEKTGAYLSTSISDGEGLGKLTNSAVRISQKGLDLVTQHLSKFGPVKENELMLLRLNEALRSGKTVTGADASFYIHEVTEATKMSKGMNYIEAHQFALSKYQVSPFSVYHPDVINAVNAIEPGSFNNKWIDFWSNYQPKLHHITPEL